MRIQKPKSYNLYTPEQWFRNPLDKMYESCETKYPHITFYDIGGVHYMSFNSYNRYLFYNYYDIYLKLEDRYDFSNLQIKALVKQGVEQHFNLMNIIPYWSSNVYDEVIFDK